MNLKMIKINEISFIIEKKQSDVDEFNFTIQNLAEVEVAKTEEGEIKKNKNEETSQIELDMLKFISKVDNEIITDKFSDLRIKSNFP